MEGATLWGYAHALLLAVWLLTDGVAFATTARLKNDARSFEARKTLLRRATALHVVPRICFALTLLTGVELTAAVNVYPVNPDLRTAGWVISVGWLLAIAVGAVAQGKVLGENLRVVELVFEAFAGLTFVAYGLNSLATGAPIDDPWFAAKLFLFGLVFWAAIAADIGFRPFYAPFNEIAHDGTTAEREESIGAAVNHALTAKAVLYLLLGIIAFIGWAQLF